MDGIEIPPELRDIFQTGGWHDGDREAAHLALIEFAGRLGDVLRETNASERDDRENWETAEAMSYGGLVAGHNHLGALAALFHEDITHSHAIVALVRAAVESFGRAFRLLEGEDAATRGALAESLRRHEIARALKKGVGLHRSDGSPVEQTEPQYKEQRHLDLYTETAVKVMRVGGASPEGALAQYSLMSAVAHGESLGIESVTTAGLDGIQFELSRFDASNYVRHAVGAAGVATLRYLDLFYPELTGQWRAAFNESLLRLKVALVD